MNLHQTLNQSRPQWFIHLDQKSHKKNKTAPCKRWGHSSVICDNRLLIYGGTGHITNSRLWESVYELNLQDWTWTRLESTNKPPKCRDSHSCVVCHNKLYIFGGSSGSESLNDTLEYDLSTNTWRTLEVRGDIPSPREGHIACLLDNRYMVMYGGWDAEETFSDCYMLDIQQKKWIAVNRKLGAEPSMREGHSLCIVRRKIYLFGGQTQPTQREGRVVDNCSNDLFRMEIVFENRQTVLVQEKVSVEGVKPSKRSSHASCCYKDRYMFIIGGEGYPPDYGQDEENIEENGHSEVKGDDEMSEEEEEYPCYPKNDVWCFDSEMSRWFEVKTSNPEEFLPIFGHTCLGFNDNLLIFGGLEDYYTSSSNSVYILSLDGTNPFAQKPAIQEKEYPNPMPMPKQYARSSQLTRKKNERENQNWSQNNLPASKQETEQEKGKKVIEHHNKRANEKYGEPLREIEESKKDRYKEEKQKVNIKLSLSTKKLGKSSFKAIARTNSQKVQNVTYGSFQRDTKALSKKSPKASLNFLRSLSGMMGWPLAAFGLFLDNALITGSSVFRINYVIGNKGKDQRPRRVTRKGVREEENAKEVVYLQLEDDGAGWSHKQFSKIIVNYDLSTNANSETSRQTEEHSVNEHEVQVMEEKENKLNEYGFNLKIGGLRLGRTLVFVTQREDEISVGLINGDENRRLELQKSPIIYYSYKVDTREKLTANAAQNKATILGCLEGIMSEEELLKGMGKISNRVVILNLNSVTIIKPDGKQEQVYELVLRKGEAKDECDIVVTNSNAEFQDFKNFKEQPLIETSLRTYFSHFFLDTSVVKLSVYINDTLLQFHNIKEYIEGKANAQNSVKFFEKNAFEGVIIKPVWQGDFYSQQEQSKIYMISITN